MRLVASPMTDPRSAQRSSRCSGRWPLPDVSFGQVATTPRTYHQFRTSAVDGLGRRVRSSASTNTGSVSPGIRLHRSQRAYPFASSNLARSATDLDALTELGDFVAVYAVARGIEPGLRSIEHGLRLVAPTAADQETCETELNLFKDIVVLGR